MFSHINEFGTLMSISSLDSYMKSGTIEQVEVIPTDTSTETIKTKKSVTSVKTKTKYQKVEPITKKFEFGGHNDVLVGIQHDSKFLKILKYISKPKKPSIYMITENDTLTFIIASGSYYPITIAKFQVTEPYFYLNSTINLCILFPYDIVLDYITADDKHHSSYTILLCNTGDGIILKYISNDTKCVKTNASITSLDKQVAISKIFTSMIQGRRFAMFDADIGVNIDYLLRIRNMEIIFTIETKTKGNFSKLSKEENVQHQLVFSDQIVKLIITKQTTVNEFILIDVAKDVTSVNPIIVWNKEATRNLRVEMIKYSNIFKSAESIPDTNDLIYYCLCKWFTYETVEAYMFVKIVVNKNIKSTLLPDEHAAPLFENVISNCNSICEYTLCYTPRAIQIN